MKNSKRILATLLIANLCASAISLPAYAETVENENGTVTEVTTETQEGTDEDGNPIITVTVIEKIDETTGNVTEDGKTVEYNKESSVTTNADGEVIYSSEKGYEKESSTTDAQPGQTVPSVEVKPEGEFSVTIPGGTVVEPEGDLPKDENDKNYDYTQTTTNNDRVVEGTFEREEGDFYINGDDSKLDCPTGPEDYEGKGYYKKPEDGTLENYRDGLLNYSENYYESLGYIDPKPGDEGYDEGFDLTWTGYGDITDGAVAVYAKDIVYMENPDGTPMLDEYGDPIIDMEKSTFVVGGNGKNRLKDENGNYIVDEDGKYVGTGMVSQSVQFALKHENGKYFYAYCMDASTGATPEGNRWYHIHNLEDAVCNDENCSDPECDGYITTEDAAMIRAIAMNGYWGTESGEGSLESLKEMLREYYDEEDQITVRYPGSNEPYVYDIYELIDGLSEYEALAVTQAAIWTYANNGDVDYNQKSYGGMVNDATVVGVLSAYKHNDSSGKPGLNEYNPAKDGESDARLQALYRCLLNLDPVYKDGASDASDYMIPKEDDAIEDVALVIHDKAEGFEENEDEDTDNDVYNTELNFTLAFMPDKDSDDILVVLYTIDEEGNAVPMKDADGNDIVRRLSGENSEGRTAETITADENGVYTLTGLQLSENAGHTFDLRLDGIQKLEKGVYIYQAHGGRKESQTLVGLAEGEQNVEYSSVMTIEFEVTECSVTVEHWWANEEGEPIDPPTEPIDPPTDPIDPPTDPIDPPTDPIDPPTDPIDPPTDPIDPPVEVEEPVVEPEEPAEEPEEPVEELVEILDEDIPLTDIPDEPIPQTGDSIVWHVASALAGIGLAVVSFFDRKKKTNA